MGRSDYTEVSAPDYGWQQEIWNRLMSRFNNEVVCAGIMGNWQNESGCRPNCVQGNVSAPFTPSETITAMFDRGDLTRTDFTKANAKWTYNGDSYGTGYSLAQWTYFTRRIHYYDVAWKTLNPGKSIGSIDTAMTCFFDEIFGENGCYTDYKVLGTKFLSMSRTFSKEAIFDVAYDILMAYEGPADKSEPVQNLRAGYGLNIYNKFAGSVPPSPGGMTVYPSLVSAVVGQTFTITVQNAPGEITVSFDGSAFTGGTVSGNTITFTAQKTGSFVITVSSGGTSIPVNVAVTDNPPSPGGSLSVSPSMVYCKLFDTFTLTCYNAQGQITAGFASSGLQLVSVTASALVFRAVSVGTYTVTVSDGKTSIPVIVAVTQADTGTDGGIPIWYYHRFPF